MTGQEVGMAERVAQQGGFALLAVLFGFLCYKMAERWVADVKAGHERESLLLKQVLEIMAGSNKLLLERGLDALRDVQAALQGLTDELDAKGRRRQP